MPERMEKRAERLQVMLTRDEIALLDAWRFEHRMPSRSAAVRALLRLAFNVDGSGSAECVPLPLDVSSAKIGILRATRQVDEVVGIRRSNGPVLVAGRNVVAAFAARAVLGREGFAVHGPVFDAASLKEEAGRRRVAAVVLAVSPDGPEQDALTDAALALGVTILVVAERSGPGTLPAKLRSLPVVDSARMPDALAGLLRGMLTRSSRVEG